MRFARGPFWLGSISKLTCSPPARESKFTLESSPVRWKKYSRPSSAAMNPNPRSCTSSLMVPVGIWKLLFSKAIHERTALSRRSTTAAQIAPPGDPFTVPRGLLNCQQRDPDHGRRRTRDLEPRGLPLPELPDPPDRHGYDRHLTHGRNHGKRRQVQG